MSDAENEPPIRLGGRKCDALKPGPRKKPCTSDPLVHYGRHFGRTVHALCNIQVLISNGIALISESANGEPELESLTYEERHEFRIFKQLLKMIPDLEESLMSLSSERCRGLADLIQKGVSSARSDDTSSLKGPILDWITPDDAPLKPPIPRNVKSSRGFNHDVTGALLCPVGLDWNDLDTRQKLKSGELIVAGDQWPIFLYLNGKYDPENPWEGLFRGELLVKGFKHIFLSPSSVSRDSKATKSGNARIHGMMELTLASLAYTATQVRFALSSSSAFSRTDPILDTEGFYNSMLDLLNDSDEIEEVNNLLMWWNMKVFPHFCSTKKLVSRNSALAKIRERRAKLKSRVAS